MQIVGVIMLKKLFEETKPIALGAGYATLYLIFAAVIDALIDTNLAGVFERPGYRSIIAYFSLYCFLVSISITDQRKISVRREGKLDVENIDRLLALLGASLAIGGLPAYTAKTVLPLYHALLIFAGLALAFVSLMGVRLLARKVKNEMALTGISFSLLFLALAFAFVAATGVGLT
ncbi:hypothetical protein HFO09_08320 [Rhizobium laguerreae]|uniref:hypothetical protein n=1 Tax=Rhizobium laguerreae TaxID=1076926 RepID=UPI001C9070A5|nr:hypothetical protein [Rhizobium laguerreae]MBY3255694.1 hypothetical protein [Rhizobium laguerreae]MBY3282733.1 hypothetical protein [Rhizobium laguerreae]MBY3289087.1 hypothetical protein [Rhizobium laguerreae]